MKRKKYFITLIIIMMLSCSTKSNYILDDSNTDISIDKISGGYRIMPKCYDMEKGLIFYPGGLVKPDAYIPLAIKISTKLNIAVFIRQMPFDLAVLNGGGAKKFLNDYNYIDTWYIAGHSLGGVLATTYIYNNPKIFSGLILLASYPMEKKGINNLDIPTISLLGSEDGLVDKLSFEKSKFLLPPNSSFIGIYGGNHAQFGSYGKQKGDNAALISEEEQQNITVDYINSFIQNIKL